MNRNLLSFSTGAGKALGVYFLVQCCLAWRLDAAEILRTNVAGTLDQTTSWVGNVPPTSADTARWDNTVATAANATAALGVDTTWGAIKVVNPAGAVVISAGNNLSIPGLNGVGIDLTAATQNLTISAPLTIAGDQEWNVAAGRTVTYNSTAGLIHGAFSVTLNGLGNVVINPSGQTTAVPSGTGTFTSNGGSLNVTNGPNNAVGGTVNVNVTNGISNGTTLALGGGTFSMTVANNSGAFTQNFAGTTLNPGASSTAGFRGANSGWSMNFAAITRNVGATLNLASSNNNNSGYKTSTGANGIVGGFVTINGTDFPRFTNGTTNIGTNNFAPVYTNDTWGTTTNTTVTTDTLQTNATTNTLRFATAAARTLTLSGQNTVVTGGLLVTAAVAGNNTLITDGQLRGSENGDLIIHQHNTAAPVTINSEIIDHTSASALTKTGPGLLILGGNNSFTGGLYLNGGSIQLANAGALNAASPGAVRFPNNSSGKLQLNGNSIEVSSLNTGTVIAATKPIIENGNATNATLTVRNTSANLYAGTLQDGTGKLGITKAGAGTLTLAGAVTSYTGNTTITEGTLALKDAAVPGTANTVSVASGTTLDVTAKPAGTFTVANGQTLTGSGTVAGTLATTVGSIIAPGSAGVGVLTTNKLSLAVGSITNIELSSTPANDQIEVLDADGLTIAGGGIQLFVAGTNQKWTTTGVYKLFKYNGTIQGAGVAALSSANILNPQGGLTYSFAENAGYVELTIGGSVAVVSEWNLDNNGSWPVTGNWTSAVPNAVGDTAQFGSVITANRTVTLDGNRTAATVEFNNTTASYNIAAGSGGSLTLDNGVGNALLTNVAGQHTIASGITLASPTTATVTAPAGVLTLSGIIADGTTSQGITKLGAGKLSLTGTANTYTGQTLIGGGTVEFSQLGSLGLGSISLASGTLKWSTGNTADISEKTVTLGSGGGVFDTNGGDVTLANPIGNNAAGGLTKDGLGTLTLAASNTHAGTNVIRQGTLSIGQDGSLGIAPAVPTTNLSFEPGTGNTATLKLTATSALAATRTVALVSGTAAIDTNGFNLTIGGNLTGTGRLSKLGAGELTLSAVNNVNATGGTTISEGTVIVNSETNLPAGGVTLDGTGNLTAGTTAFFSPVVVNGTNEIKETGAGRIMSIGNLSGAGTLTVTNGYVTDFVGNTTAFSGTIIFSGTGGYRWNGATGSTQLTLDTAGNEIFVRNNAPNIAIGALTGNGTLAGSGGGAIHAVTYTIGQKNIDTTFSGRITNGVAPVSLVKAGTAVLTLTGNAHTFSGDTTVSGGTLAVTNPIFADTSAIRLTTGATLHLNHLQGDLVGQLYLDNVAQFAGSWGSLTSLATNKTELITGNGILYVGVPIDPYDAWAMSKNLTSANAGKLLDPDEDGIANLLEFVLASDPLVPSRQALPLQTVDATNITLTFKRNDAAETLHSVIVQTSTDLDTWADIAVSLVTDGAVAVTENDAEPDDITVTIPRSGAEKRFVRLKVVTQF